MGPKPRDPVPESEIEFNFTVFLPIERDFHDLWAAEWLNIYIHVPVWCGAIYLITIYNLKRFMKDRTPFSLRVPLAMWSGTLAVFSAIGASRLVGERVHIVQNYGWIYSVCHGEYYSGPVTFWGFLFVISKIYELGDTIFIILRKQKLIFLHWYHHIVTMLFAWWLASKYQVFSRWPGPLNYTVHAFMYSYYTLKALKVQVPKAVAMCITVMQISQMIVGLTLAIFTIQIKRSGIYCRTDLFHLYVTCGVYGSYFILFTYFFYVVYLANDRVTKSDTRKKE